MALIERMGEGLARRMDRRRLLRRAAGAVFGMTTAIAIKGFRPDRAFASSCGAYDQGCYCNPPNGTYCTAYSYDYCYGASCNTSLCSVNLSSYPDTGGC